MKLIEVLQNVDIQVLVALIGSVSSFLGVIIGSFITISSNFFFDWLKCKKEKTEHYSKIREELYFEFYKSIHAVKKYAQENNSVYMEKYVKDFFITRCKLDIYTSKKFRNAVDKILKNDKNSIETITEEKIEKILFEIRKDLNIKD